MPWEFVVIILFGGLLVGLFAGVPVAFTLGGIGILCALLVWGPQGTSLVIASSAYNVSSNYVTIAVPLFVFMGEIAMVSGVTGEAYKGMDNTIGRLPGGLAIAAVGTSCLFGAVSGVSMAACAAVGSMALPEMRRRGYDNGLAIGAVGGGACLDILIPPSVMLVIYGLLANVSVPRLFFAGLVPGLLSAGLFSAYIMIRCTLNPKLAPYRSTASFKETLKSLKGLVPLLLLIMVVLGVIWFGVATATEAAGIGAAGSMLLALGYRKLNWGVLKRTVLTTVKMTCMLLYILIGATLFTQMLAYLGAASSMSETIATLSIPRWAVIVVMFALVQFLGMFMDSGSILMITVPIFVPVIVNLGFDPLWFGILLAINAELDSLTPPVGTNLFVLKGILPDVSFGEIVKGTMPYWGLHILVMLSVGFVPSLVTWLPNLMKGPGS